MTDSGYPYSVGERIVRAVAVTACLGLLLNGWVSWLSWAAPMCEQEHQTAQTSPEDCPALYRAAIMDTRVMRNAVSDFLNNNAAAIGALATIAIAWFTLTLKWSTDKLWQAHRETIRETARIAEEEFVAAHPPEVRIKHVWFNGEIWKGEKISFRIVIVNRGKTIAQVMECYIKTLIVESDRELPSGDVAFPDVAKFQITPHTLHSGATFDMPEVTDNRVLTDADNVALRGGKKKLYCIGGIEYLDRAGRIKKTAFCRVLKFPTDPRSYLDIGRFFLHDDPEYEYQD